MFKRVFSIIPVFLFFSFVLNAQVNNFKIEKFNVQSFSFEQGLQSNSIKEVVTDTFGFVWISTQTGLEKYDGINFENIVAVIGKDSIKINSFSFLLTLQNGRIWFSCKQGIFEYNPFTDSYRYIYKPLQNNQIFFPVKEVDDGVWFLENDKKFVKFSKKNGAIKDGFLFESYSATSFNILSTEPVLTSNKDFFFIKNNNGNIAAINIKTHAVHVLNIAEKEITKIACTDNTLFISSTENLFSYSINRNTVIKKFAVADVINTPFSDVPSLILKNNNLFVSLDNRLFRADTNFKIQVEYNTQNNEPLVKTGYIRSLYLDNFNCLWVITNDNLKKVENTDLAFENFSYTNEKNNFIRSLYYDKETNRLLAGCYEGGIQLYDSSGNVLWQNALYSDEIKDVLSIEKLKTDVYLIATFYKGFFLLNLSSKKITPFNFIIDGKKKPFQNFRFFTSNLQRVDDSTIYISFPENIYKCTFKQDKLLKMKPCFPSKYSLDNDICVCFFASNGTVWAGTLDGLVYCITAQEKFSVIQLPNFFSLRSLTEDTLHNIWIGTEKGLYVYSQNQQLKKKYFIENGLKNDCIYSLAVDKKTNAVFASTNLGISKINDNGTIKNYGRASGLQNVEFNTQAFTASPSEKFFFGNVAGITSFYPQTLNTIKDNPRLLIYKINVNNQLYKTDSAAWSKSSLTLAYDQNTLSFFLSAVGLQSASDYQYEYKMENFDKDWAITNTPENIHYSLSPGKYIFKVRLAGFNIIKSESIVIEEPFWQSWWFYILVFAAFVFAVFLFAKFFFRKKYAQQLYALELQQKLSSERERISRDLHDNLGAYTSAISTQVDDIVQQFGIQNNSAVRQLKGSAREIMFQLRDTIWALNKEKISITMLSDRIKNYIQKISPAYTHIEFDVEEAIETEKFLSSVNGLHVFRILQEAIHNAIKHSFCTNITIYFFSGKSILISVSDNGEGFKKNITDGEGLKNMKQRVEEIGWELSFENKTERGFTVQLTNNNTK